MLWILDRVLPFVFADPLLHQHIFWHARWDIIHLLNPDIDAENVITVLEAGLMEEQRQAMEKAMEDYRQLCLKSFSLSRSGEVIQK